MCCVAWAVTLTASCGGSTTSGNAPSELARPKLLAVVAEPAEARPGEWITLQTYGASPSGPTVASDLSATFCLLPRPLEENNSANEACFDAVGSPLSIAGDSAVGRVPLNACALFGPDPPPGDARPQAPDGSGGFFVPIVLSAFGRASLFLQRVQCAPADVDADTARAFAAEYTPNANPPSATWALEPGREGQRITIRLPAEAAETFVLLDPASRRLVTKREVLRVEWLATEGDLGPTFQELVLEHDEWVARTDWSAQKTEASLWAIVRDSRGGVSVARLFLDE